jgi:hypothetical protein
MTRLIDISDIYLDQPGEPDTAQAIIDAGEIAALLVGGSRLTRDWALRVLGVDAVWQIERYEFSA